MYWENPRDPGTSASSHSKAGALCLSLREATGAMVAGRLDEFGLPWLLPGSSGSRAGQISGWCFGNFKDGTCFPMFPIYWGESFQLTHSYIFSEE